MKDLTKTKPEYQPVTIEFTPREAAFLCWLTSKIGGDPSGPRSVPNKLLAILENNGYRFKDFKPLFGDARYGYIPHLRDSWPEGYPSDG